MMAVCQPLRALYPDTALLPARNLRIAIHVFQDDSGNGNFHDNTLDEKEFLNRLVDWVNHRLANLDTLKPAVSSPFVADCRVRIRLDTIYYHRDSRAWDCSVEIDAPYMRDRYVDADTTLDYLKKYQTLPVFIGANNQVTGGHSRNIGDRGYIAVRGYYENFLRQTAEAAVDECGRNLVHELGHCLGLGHNFQGGPGGDQCDNCDDNGCPVEGSSNNIMDYWPSYGYGLSKCQFNRIHFCLDGGSGNISEVVINDSCFKVSATGYQVSGKDTLWVRDTVYSHGDLWIKSGGTLKVSGYLSMPADTKITMEPGAHLEIDGGTIGNLCGDLWLGIRLNCPPGGKPSYFSVTGRGAIENARAGLIADCRINAVINNAVFRNCRESLVFLNGSADSIHIGNSDFLITGKLNHYEEGVTPGSFVRSEGIPRLVVTGCTFVNEPGTLIFDADWMGTGISAYGRFLEINNSGFVNLTSGLDLYSYDTDAKVDVAGCRFMNNRYGVKTRFAGVQVISRNQFVLQRFNSGSTIGILLGNPDRFAVNLNRFESVYGGGHQAGMVIKDPSKETSPVFNNQFSNLPDAILVDGPPEIDSLLFQWAREGAPVDSSKLGPQFRYNQFDTVSLFLAMITDSVFGTAAGQPTEMVMEDSICASDWSTGGFGWYSDSIKIMAFHGWKAGGNKLPDHGLFWFMNYQVLSSSGQTGSGPAGYESLTAYLEKLSDLDYSLAGDPVRNMHDILGSVSQVPAAARSSRIARLLEKYNAGDQVWIREALASMAGRFVREDSLLTDLGTRAAKNNLARWMDFRPDISPDHLNPYEFDLFSDYDLPDFSAFRFTKHDQEKVRGQAFIPVINPAQDFITIYPQSGYTFNSTWNGIIFSVDGRFSKRIAIGSWRDQRVDISSLKAGVYFIELFSGNQYLGAGKFVKVTHR